MTFKSNVEKILKDEITKMIEQQGYVLETIFCTGICEKYSLAICTVRPTLRRIYPEMSLIKRRMSNELRRFYKMDVKGCPIVYIPDK